MLVQSGYIVLKASGASGGVSYTRTWEGTDFFGTDGELRTFRTVRNTDHRHAVEWCGKVASAVDATLRRVCVSTAIGYFLPLDKADTLEAALSSVRDEAKLANEFALNAGSNARVRVGYVLVKLDLASPDAAREIGRSVRETLESIKSALESGAVGRTTGLPNQLASPWERAKGLPDLCTGIAGEQVKAALALVPDAAKAIRAADKAGEALETVSARTDAMNALSLAIDWYAEGGIGG